ncbi:MAG: hypothetical protein MJ168_10805 [Clostridia bacterium]|nr:hypothetical protein [Clostridia bacterium]
MDDIENKLIEELIPIANSYAEKELNKIESAKTPEEKKENLALAFTKFFYMASIFLSN